MDEAGPQQPYLYNDWTMPLCSKNIKDLSLFLFPREFHFNF